ncbi:MAG: BON domain-containing protein [Colwellia sp.]|nr:BON domain-containing protein [Colwellia sp.]
MNINYTVRALILVSLLVSLQGCVGVATVAVVSGASIITDHRTISKQIDDQTIEFNASTKISENESLQKQTNLHLVCINGAILIIGQAPNSYLRDLAVKEVSSIKGVQKVHNQIRIGNTTAFTTRTNDVWLTSKVKTALFSSDTINPTNIKVITENSEVFLMGIVSQEEADEAVDIARNISGVSRVFMAFEYQ